MMMSDIQENRKDIGEMQLRVSSLEDAVHDQALSLARIDENIKAIRGAVEAIATKN